MNYSFKICLVIKNFWDISNQNNVINLSYFDLLFDETMKQDNLSYYLTMLIVVVSMHSLLRQISLSNISKELSVL